MNQVLVDRDGVCSVTFQSNGLEHPAKFRPVDLVVVVDNLLDNARKNGATRMQMLARRGRGGRATEIIITDDGRGLNEERVDPARIFDKGYSSAPGGTGLGPLPRPESHAGHGRRPSTRPASRARTGNIRALAAKEVDVNLTFRICWVEDQASDAEVDAVKDAVRANGFEAEIDAVKTEQRIDEFAEQQRHFHDFDLILLDLMLGDGLRGDDLAPKVRGGFRSTPILFYSAETAKKLRKMMAAKGIEGVYCTHRRSLATRVGELVHDLSPALNRLSGMRGLAARVVAECDDEFRTILLHLAGGLVPETDLVQSLKQRVNTAKTRQTGRIGSINTLVDLLDQQAISSGLLFDEVRDRISGPLPDETFALRRALNNYPELVLSRRNTLAHALEDRTGAGWRIIRRGSNPNLTVDDFAQYRADFLTHLRDVRRLRKLLVL